MEQTYANFIESEGIPIHRSMSTRALEAVEVGPWARLGGNGAFIQLDGRGLADAYLIEIPGNGELREVRHLFEELVYVVEGSGRTEFWNDAGYATGFNWEKGSVFAIPLNVHFKHLNAGASPARLFAITNAPVMLNLFHDVDFVFDCEHDFLDRYDEGHVDFRRPVVPDENCSFSGFYVPNAVDVPLPPNPRRGANGSSLMLELANCSLGAHMSEFAPGSYKKAHRHGAGAHVMILSGTGYSLLWKGNDHWTQVDRFERIDWEPGAVFAPPEMWFHQHFNTGDGPARYLALRFAGGSHGIIPEYTDPRPTTQGGDQVEYEEEDPKTKQLFDEEMAKSS